MTTTRSEKRRRLVRRARGARGPKATLKSFDRPRLSSHKLYRKLDSTRPAWIRRPPAVPAPGIRRIWPESFSRQTRCLADPYPWPWPWRCTPRRPYASRLPSEILGRRWPLSAANAVLTDMARQRLVRGRADLSREALWLTVARCLCIANARTAGARSPTSGQQMLAKHSSRPSVPIGHTAESGASSRKRA